MRHSASGTRTSRANAVAGRASRCECGGRGPPPATRRWRRAKNPLPNAHFRGIANCRACLGQGRLRALPEPASARHAAYALSRSLVSSERSKRMALERTLSIVKPDGIKGNHIGEVYRRFELAGLSIIAARMLHLSQREAEGFYAVHRERPFFRDLVRYMTSGPVLVQVLEGENAVSRNREIMGATDPKKAAAGTIRADLAASIEQNVVHGSDAPETAEREIAYFFSGTELHSRA